MKKMILITMALLLTGAIASFGQENEVKLKKEKNNQYELYNDFYVSYGMGTVFYFIEHLGVVATSSPGTIIVGYGRSLNKVIAVGFQVSYSNITRSGETYDYNSSTTYTQKVTDKYWQGIVNVRFRYLNKSSFCMYSGIGIGVTMDYYTNEQTTTKKGQQLLPAGQFTLLGFRVGRALSFFGEFGIGTNSIVNCGLSYKFGDNE